MVACALCALAALLATMQAAHGQPTPPSAAATTPAPSMSITLLGPGPVLATTQMPVNGKLPHLAGARKLCATIKAPHIHSQRCSPHVELAPYAPSPSLLAASPATGPLPAKYARIAVAVATTGGISAASRVASAPGPAAISEVNAQRASVQHPDPAVASAVPATNATLANTSFHIATDHVGGASPAHGTAGAAVALAAAISVLVAAFV